MNYTTFIIKSNDANLLIDIPSLGYLAAHFKATAQFFNRVVSALREGPVRLIVGFTADQIVERILTAGAGTVFIINCDDFGDPHDDDALIRQLINRTGASFIYEVSDIKHTSVGWDWSSIETEPFMPNLVQSQVNTQRTV